VRYGASHFLHSWSKGEARVAKNGDLMAVKLKESKLQSLELCNEMAWPIGAEVFLDRILVHGKLIPSIFSAALTISRYGNISQ